MNALLSVDQLAVQVNDWCLHHQVVPANGQAGERVTERNIRYYRTLGLLDPPSAGGGRGYGEKHFLQLVAIRLLQAQGLPLSRIRNLLYGRSLDELKRIENDGSAEWQTSRAGSFQPQASESWSVTLLDEEYMLISRRGRSLSPEIREQLVAVLNNLADGPSRTEAQ